MLEGQADGFGDLGEEGLRCAWLGRCGRLAAAWLGDCVAAVGGEVVERLHLPAWPTDAEGVDGLRLAKAEVHVVVVAREEPGHRVGLANLFPRLALDLDDGAQSVAVAPGAGQADDDAVALVAKVAVNACRFVDVGHDEVEVAVAVEIAVGGGVAHAFVVEAPQLGGLLKLQVALVAVGEVDLFHRGLLFPQFPLGFADEHLRGDRDVGVGDHARGAVGDEDIDTAVVVEVGQLDGPRPVRPGQAAEEGRLHEARRAGVEEEVVAHDLARPSVLEKPAPVAHVAHGDLGLVMGRRGHVGNEQIQQPVVVQVGAVRPHRRPTRVRHRLLDHVGERAVAVVVIKMLRIGEVVGHVEVHPAVAVVIPPRRREAVAFFRDPGALADIGIMARAVIPEKPIRTATGVHGPVRRPHPAQIVIFLERGEYLRAAVTHDDGSFRGSATGPVVSVGYDKQVEIAVPVMVGKRRHERGVDHRQPPRLRLVGETDACAVVDEKLVGRVVVANVQVQIAVAVEIDRRRAGTPRIAPVNPGLLGHVLKAEIGFLEKQAVLVRAVDQKQIWPAVAIEVADADSATDKAGTVEPAQPVILREALGELDTGLRRRKPFKQRCAIPPGGPFTQRLGNNGRCIRLPRGGKGSAIAAHRQKQQADSPVQSGFAHRPGIRRLSGRICQCRQRSQPGQTIFKHEKHERHERKRESTWMGRMGRIEKPSAGNRFNCAWPSAGGHG